MTQPTIEHVLEEIRRLPVRCEIQKLDNSPSDEFLRGWALGIAMASKTAKDECSKLSQLVSALTAQAGEQIDDAKRLDYLDARNAAKNLRHGTKYGWQLNENYNRIALEDHGWPSLKVREAIDAAIAAAKGE